MAKTQKCLKKIKQDKGITLVTLAIAIIIIIVLSTVTITTTFGENGLVQQSQKTKELSVNQTTAEDERTNEILSNYDEIMNGEDENLKISALVIAINQLNTDMEKFKTQITEQNNKIEEQNNLINEQNNKITQLENNIGSVTNLYPVGSIYISTSLSTASAVASALGGTWEAYGQGRTLIGVGTGTDSNSRSQTFAVNATGGEYSHTLTIAEMPSHNHRIDPGAMSWPVNGNSSWGWNTDWVANPSPHVSGINNTQNTGNSEAHNNIQPYITVYMWRRIS